MLHLSRNAFFFLSGLVICYSQITHPRGLREFWKRRYVQLGVPYLAWTAIYLVFTLIMVSLSWHEVWLFLRQNLLMGYSQLYPAFVIFQFCLVFPLFLRMLRSTRRHNLIMAVSLGFALVFGFTLHYPWLSPPLTDVWNAMGSVVPWSRDLLTYQEFFVAGTLVALHFDEVSDFVSRHYRHIFALSVVIGGLMVLWYAIQVDIGTSLLRASDPYQAGSGDLVLCGYRCHLCPESVVGTEETRTLRSSRGTENLSGSGGANRWDMAVAQSFPELPAGRPWRIGFTSKSAVGSHSRHPLFWNRHTFSRLFFAYSAYATQMGTGRAGAIRTTSRIRSGPQRCSRKSQQ